MRINYAEFLVRWLPLSALMILVTVILRRRGLLRPVTAPVLSWEMWLFVLCRWPYIARGVLAAVALKVRPRPIGFAVTPKTRGGLERLPSRLVTPYLVVTLGLSAAALVGEHTTNTAGYVFLCLLGAATYAAVALAVPVLHAREAATAGHTSALAATRATAMLPLTLAAATVLPLAVAVAQYPSYAARVFGW